MKSINSNLILHGDWAPGDRKVILDLPADNIHLLNLEGPLLSNPKTATKIIKAGPNISNSYEPNFQGQTIVSLANNHIMDYCNEALISTTNSLKSNEILYTGAGKSKSAARIPVIISMNNKISIAIIACCETQYGEAQTASPGVATLGPWVFDKIRHLRKKVDYIVVSIHSGPENSPWPMPIQTELYKAFVNAGASIVHGHHPHIAQGWEKYKKGYIYYGLGNFAIDPRKWHTNPNSLWSLGVSVNFQKDKFSVELITFEIIDQNNFVQVSRSNKQQFATHMNYISNISQPLNDNLFLNEIWQEMSLYIYNKWGERSLIPSKEKILGRKRKFLQILKSLLGIIRNSSQSSYFQEMDYCYYYNLFSCISHREMYKTALGILSGVVPDIRSKRSKQAYSAFLRNDL